MTAWPRARLNHPKGDTVYGHQPRRNVRAVALAAALVLGTLLWGAAPVTAGSPSGSAYCGVTGLHTFRWIGPDGGQWEDPANWQSASGTAPGQTMTAPFVDYACIPSGSRVQLDPGGAGIAAELAALDLGPSAVLTVGRGGALVLHGGPDGTQSVARTRSTLTMDRSTLGGEATLLVKGTLDWLSQDGDTSTETTRRCDVADPPGAACHGPAPDPGRTVIDTDGRLLVRGNGVNLEDSRVIENRGTTVLSGQGYIAADAGTGVVNSGTFSITNGKGVFQGRVHYGLPVGTFVDSGTVRKQGSGASVIGLAFRTGGSGRVAVLAGSLSVYSAANGSSTTSVASVRQGASFGTGACAAGAATCATTSPTAADRQTAKVALPALGSDSVQVSLTELPGQQTSADHMAPVQVDTPGAAADDAHPLVLTFAIDSSAFPAGSDAVAIASSIKVYRRGDGDSAYALVKGCAATGGPSPSTPSCVDRAASAAATRALGSGDVVLVVRTVLNSRWVA